MKNCSTPNLFQDQCTNVRLLNTSIPAVNIKYNSLVSFSSLCWDRKWNRMYTTMKIVSIYYI